jgi:hypothetical protein
VVERRALITGPLSWLSIPEQRLLRALIAIGDIRVIAKELQLPAGSVGPLKMRMLRKLRRLTEADLPAEPRADLEAALRTHSRSPAPEPPAARRGLLRFLGLTRPEPPPRTHPGDRTVAAVRDVTGAGRDVLREVVDVLDATHRAEDRP